jgi:hypothetical protein
VSSSPDNATTNIAAAESTALGTAARSASPIRRPISDIAVPSLPQGICSFVVHVMMSLPRSSRNKQRGSVPPTDEVVNKEAVLAAHRSKFCEIFYPRSLAATTPVETSPEKPDDIFTCYDLILPKFIGCDQRNRTLLCPSRCNRCESRWENMNPLIKHYYFRRSRCFRSNQLQI